MKKAVIDLGTNTFHLLIVELTGPKQFKEIYRERIYVKLAEGGIETIIPIAIERAENAMFHFSKKLKEYDCPTIKAIGTAALRTASNGSDFITKIKTETGIQIELIDGMEEANLIYHGVRNCVAFDSENQLIIDIGGGSTEFIICNDTQMHWAQSFPIGVGVLYKKFHHSDPISKEEINATIAHLEEMLQPLFSKTKKYRPTVLTGSAGAFETISEMMPHVKMTDHFNILKMEHFPPVRDFILNASLKERLAHPNISEMRAEMMVVALVLIQFILEKTGIEQVFVSNYALKEGFIFSS